MLFCLGDGFAHMLCVVVKYNVLLWVCETSCNLVICNIGISIRDYV